MLSQRVTAVTRAMNGGREQPFLFCGRKVNMSQPGGSGEVDPLQTTSYGEAKERNSKINQILFHLCFIIMLQWQSFCSGKGDLDSAGLVLGVSDQ